MHAPVATRGSHITLSFGLLSIPVTLFSTTTEYRIDKKQFRTVLNNEGQYEDHPVGYENVDKVTGEIVGRDEIVKKVATEYGFVFVEDSEVERLFDLSPNTAKVKAFQDRSLWESGHYVPKRSFAVEVQPTKTGKKKVPNRDAEKVLQLILEVMAERNAIAVLELTTRGIPKPAVLLSDGTLWEVHWDEEIREERPKPERAEMPEPFYEQVRTLVQSLWHEDPVGLSDTRTTLIQSYADEKARAGDFAKPVEIEPVVEAAGSDDLMAMLMASVEAAKAS